ncbi:MAG: hypothetical protein ABEK17_02405 [Candidatus Aenigmatarchaeota archaeon]
MSENVFSKCAKCGRGFKRGDSFIMLYDVVLVENGDYVDENRFKAICKYCSQDKDKGKWVDIKTN